jgi:hypothetical protein
VAKDKERLIQFASQLFLWLDGCYLQESRIIGSLDHWPVIRPYVELRDLGESAWRELKERSPLTALVARINGLTDEKLIVHGLSGAQLNYKFAVIDILLAKLKKVKFPGRFRVKLVDAIDTILDSLIAAVGVGTALKEIKDMLRAQITA